MTGKNYLGFGAMGVALALAACGTGEHVTDQDADAIDEQILGDADNSDPALTEALGDQIMVDPDLAGQSNQHAALPGDAVAGAPIPDTMHNVVDAQAAMAAGDLLSAPQATSVPDDGRSAAGGATTLGALAEREHIDTCQGSVTYGNQWASTMPTAFDVYPHAELIEAAGYDAAGCKMRVASFRTSAPMQRMINWYYTRAIRSGYSAEHQLRGGAHVLGGYRSRDQGAYFIVFDERGDGGTNVDIVANDGK